MSIDVVAMTPDDAGWAAEMMHARWQGYGTYSPVFWRSAGWKVASDWYPSRSPSVD